MLLREAKEILRKNGYRLTEAFDDDLANFRQSRKKYRRQSGIEGYRPGSTDFNKSYDIFGHDLQFKLTDGRGSELKEGLVWYALDKEKNWDNLQGYIHYDNEAEWKKLSKRVLADIIEDDEDDEIDIAEFKAEFNKIKAEVQKKVEFYMRRLDRVETATADWLGSFLDMINFSTAAEESYYKENPPQEGDIYYEKISNINNRRHAFMDYSDYHTYTLTHIAKSKSDDPGIVLTDEDGKEHRMKLSQLFKNFIAADLAKKKYGK